MRIGIVGPADRAVAWERHIRPQRVVSEVAIAPELKDIGDIDACILLQEEENQLEVLLNAIKMGFHSFLVSRLPQNTNMVRKIYHAAEESNVRLQFSHWPSLSPLYQWMKQRVPHPQFGQINREIDYQEFMEMDAAFDFLWIDEIALALKWVNHSIHHVDAQQINLSGPTPYAMHIYLRFENGATFSIWVNATAHATTHHRRVSNAHYLLDCDVPGHTIRHGRKGSGGHLFFEKQTMQDTDSASNAATQFLKAIRLNRSTPFNGYDTLRLCKTIDAIKGKMSIEKR